jgi:hypothetical protein
MCQLLLLLPLLLLLACSCLPCCKVLLLSLSDSVLPVLSPARRCSSKSVTDGTV